MQLIRKTSVNILVFKLYLCRQKQIKMKSFFLIIALFLFCQGVTAQAVSFNLNETTETETHREDADYMEILNRLDINQDSRLNKLLEWHIENNKKIEGLDGYRIEIFFSSSLNAKDLALNKKKEFLSKYPGYNVHVKFSAPNFKVRVGDFRTKNEALKLYKKIQNDYPGAFIVPDIIDFPTLKADNYE